MKNHNVRDDGGDEVVTMPLMFELAGCLLAGCPIVRLKKDCLRELLDALWHGRLFRMVQTLWGAVEMMY